MKRTGFTGYGYDSSVDYEATNVDGIKDIHKYLMKKNNIVQMNIFSFVKKGFCLRVNSFIKFYKCIKMYFNKKLKNAK